MLDSIFTKYTKKGEGENNNFSAGNSIKNPFSSENKEKKYKKESNNDFLNEQVNLEMMNKCDEVMKKYCSLYADEEKDTETSSNNFSIKPLNYRYNEYKQRKSDNSNTTGEGWFNMKAPDMTPELREDLKAVQLRHIIDPARFYKKMDREKIPKFFQIGTVQDNILEGKKNRLKKNEVKQRLAEEFLESDLAKNYSLRKFEELQAARRKIGLKKSKINKYKMQVKKKARKSEFIVK